MAKVIFMGTPDFAVRTLERLIAEHEVIGVVTQPDRPAGRKNILQPPPVKTLAQAHDIPVLQPLKIRKTDAISELKALGVPDVFVVAAFGQILPQAVLDIPPHGSINVHASLLPRWRGAAPIQAAIRAGDAQTGVTIMQMDAGLDTGAMLRARAIDIAPNETGASLHDKLAEVGADLLIETLPAYLNGEITPQPQDDAQSTFAPQIEKQDGQIDWTQDAASIERTVRAFTPWPSTYTHWNGQYLKVIGGSTADGSAPVGKLVWHNGALAVGTGAGLFVLDAVQLAGSKPTPVSAFINGHADFVGATLGSS